MKEKLSAAQVRLVERMKAGPIRVASYYSPAAVLVKRGIAQWTTVHGRLGQRIMLQLRKEKE